MADVEEWVVKLVDQASGNAAKIAAGLTSMDAAQVKAAQSAIQLGAAQRAALNAHDLAERAKEAAAAKPGDAGAAAKAEEAAYRADAAAARALLATRKEQLKIEEEARRAAAAGAGKKGADAADPEKVLGRKAAQKEVFSAGTLNALNAMKDIGGPVGFAAGKAEEIAASVARIGPHATAALYAFKALVYVITAGAVALAGMMAAAIEVAGTRAQLLATFSALGGGAAGGAKTLAIVEKMSAALPFAASKVAEWATELQKANLQGRALESAVKAVAAAQALMGDSGAQAAQSLIASLAKGGAEAAQLIQKLKIGGPEARDQLAQMGLRVEDVAAALGMTVAQFKAANVGAEQMAKAVEKALGKKGAGPLADLMLTFPAILSKAKEGFLSLFDKLGPAVKPFMAAVKSLFGEFSKGGGVINAVKPIVTAVLSTAFKWATMAVNAIHGIVQAFLSAGKSGGIFSGAIAVLKGGWAALVTIFKIVSTALSPIVALFKLIFSNALVLQGLKTIFTLIAVAVTAVVVVIGVLVGVVASIAGVVGGAIGALMGLVTAAWGVAGAIVEGLIGGLDVGAFVSKMAEMASAGLAAFKNKLGIASPSRVMKQMGGHTVEGFTQGVDDNAPDAQASMDAMVSPRGGAPAQRGGGKGGPVFNFINCVFGGGITQSDVDAMMQSWWERLANGSPMPEKA